MEKKAFTLSELLIATLILSLVLTTIVAMYTTATASIQKAKDLTIATSYASNVLEHIKSLSLSQTQSYKDNSTYWNSLVDSGLPGQVVNVTNTNASDTNWNNDPLSLEVTISWQRQGRNKSLTMQSKFADTN